MFFNVALWLSVHHELLFRTINILKKLKGKKEKSHVHGCAEISCAKLMTKERKRDEEEREEDSEGKR
jgi:hypothetical protein